MASDPDQLASYITECEAEDYRQIKHLVIVLCLISLFIIAVVIQYRRKTKNCKWVCDVDEQKSLI